MQQTGGQKESRLKKQNKTRESKWLDYIGRGNPTSELEKFSVGGWIMPAKRAL